MIIAEEQSFVDTDKLFLFGQSQGGMVSALTAAGRADEVKAMLLVYPAFCIVHDLHEFIPDISEVTGDVVDTAMGQLGAIYATDAYDLDVMSEISKLFDKCIEASYDTGLFRTESEDTNSRR